MPHKATARRIRPDWYCKPTLACENYYFYGNLYAAQAMFQAGGADWATWFKGAQEDLVSKARRKGDTVYWEDPRGFGDAYATASACLRSASLFV